MPSSLMHLDARSVGLFISTWSPGDGATRYRFTRRPSDYFGSASDALVHTAVGNREAELFLMGYRRGYLAGRQAERSTP